jgi:hypothetical protein
LRVEKSEHQAKGHGHKQADKQTVYGGTRAVSVLGRGTNKKGRRIVTRAWEGAAFAVYAHVLYKTKCSTCAGRCCAAEVVVVVAIPRMRVCIVITITVSYGPAS